jgi:Fic family protein
MPNDPRKPYDDLPLLPPKADLESRAILKACVGARTAVAELRMAGQLIPDQSVLIQIIPMLEARASSEIENIVTTNDALFREANLGGADDSKDPAAKEALRYRTAVFEGFQALKTRPLSSRMVVDLCRTIKGVELDVRATPGTTLANKQTGEVIYTPPQGQDRLRELLANWEQFIHGSGEIDPLVRMAVQHYQFEAIHPFTDGNGRTGRVLMILQLIQDGLLDLPTLYLSRYILATRGDYYRLLNGVTSNAAWEPWILYILKGVESTSTWTNLHVRAIRQLMDETVRHVRARAPKIYSRDLIELIFSKPYVRVANVVEAGIAQRQTAATHLKMLVTIGILREEKVGRDKLYIHRKYLDLLSSDAHAFEPYSAEASAKAT